MDYINSTLQVNKFARRTRHLKTFSKAILAKSVLQSIFSFFSFPFIKFFETSFGNIIESSIFNFKNIFPVAPQKRLLVQTIIISSFILLISSLSYTSNFIPVNMTSSEVNAGTVTSIGNVLISDDSGYLVKINPQTSTSNRIGLNDYAVHVVETGESLSIIAEKYGIKVDTVMWENNINNPNAIRSGQSLMIPPVDGLSYKVARGDNLEKIANTYKISSEAIIAQNNLESITIHRGQELFLPGAEPLRPVIASNPAPTRNTATRTDVRAVSAVSATPSSAAPVGGRPFIFPTRGRITQGFHAGHYALDIGDRSRPPVWASGGGTVEKVSTGTWGGGYGNHIILNHGNGLKTLYAHLGSVNVYQGQYVNQGDVIGMMGNTGRVYGATGIHLHWEVILNGVKQNPRNYY